MSVDGVTSDIQKVCVFFGGEEDHCCVYNGLSLLERSEIMCKRKCVTDWLAVRVSTKERTGQDRTGQDRTGQERKGKERKGQDRTGQDRKGKERKGKERKGKERKGKERKGKERKGKERKGKERKGKEESTCWQHEEQLLCLACKDQICRGRRWRM